VKQIFTLFALFIVFKSDAQQIVDSKTTIQLVETFNNVIKKFYDQEYLTDQKDEANGFILPGLNLTEGMMLLVIKANVDSDKACNLGIPILAEEIARQSARRKIIIE